MESGDSLEAGVQEPVSKRQLTPGQVEEVRKKLKIAPLDSLCRRRGRGLSFQDSVVIPYYSKVEFQCYYYYLLNLYTAHLSIRVTLG